jgi:hypothetical protein
VSPRIPATSDVPTDHPQAPADPLDDPAHAPDGIRALGELAQALHDLGLEARLVKSATRPAFVRAKDPAAPALAEDITCDHDPDRGLSFFYSWGDPIAPVQDMDVAADSVRRVLTPGTRR